MEDRIEVTSENFGDLLIAGLREAVAVQRGELEPARIVQRPVTARAAEVAKPPRFTAERIVRVREALQVSQPVFAGMLNVSASTVRAWERGVRVPDGPTLRLLELAEKHPGVLLETVLRKLPMDAEPGPARTRKVAEKKSRYGRG